MSAPPLLGSDVEVPCADGIQRRYVNLDYAASTPVMAAVWEAVEAFVPWYSSVHRGTGAKSRISTDAYEHARDAVARFVGAPQRHGGARAQHDRGDQRARDRAAAGHAGALHARRAPREHAPVAPRTTCACCPFPHTPAQLLEDTRARAAGRRTDLVAVTGASNVTGEVWPLARARRRSPTSTARSCSSTPRSSRRTARSTWSATGIDHLALSGHKLYAPFGAGALVSGAPLTGDPLIKGGGAVKLVTRRRRALGRRAGALRGGLAERDRRRRARRGVRAPRHGASSRRSEWALVRAPARRAWTRSTASRPRAVARLPRPRRRGHVHARRLARHRSSRRRSATSSRSACATAASARTRCSPACSNVSDAGGQAPARGAEGRPRARAARSGPGEPRARHDGSGRRRSWSPR